MTIRKSDDEILSSSYDNLTDEEYEYQQYLEELIWWGYYEPYPLDIADMVEVMRRNNIISKEDADNLHYTQERPNPDQ